MVRIALVVVAALTLASGASAANGRNLYFANCVWCHGDRLQGVPGSGPSLQGAGALAADFYLRTGYMPLRSPRQKPTRRPPHFTEPELRALISFVAAHGGPPVPRVHPERGNLAAGLELFTEHCAGCHQVVAEGGILTGAKAPPLDRASPVEIAEAVRIGPYVMPKFSRSDISDAQLNSIIAYVEYAKHPRDEGGWGLDHLGPFPEGMVVWGIAIVVLLAVCRALGKGMSREEGA